MQLFHPEGPLATYGMKVFNILILNLLWIFLSFFSGGLLLGFCTIGMYKGVHAGIAPGTGFAPIYFFKPLQTIKKRWGILIFGSLFNFLIIAMGSMGVYFTLSGVIPYRLFLPVYALIVIEGILVSLYAIPLIAHTKMPFKTVYTYGFALANRHILWSLCGLVLIVGSIALLLSLSPEISILLLLILPSLIFSCISYVVIHFIFPKYDLDAFGLEIDH